ncbi:MAG: hypothetical protein NVSMB51_10100 [Solirubrobacteraceae bacterium]
MSFRRRLAVFFLVIVAVPMGTVALVIYGLITDNEIGKADAGLAEGSRAAAAIYRSAGTNARARARVARVAGDPVLARSLERRDYARAQRRAQALLQGAKLARMRVSLGARTVVDAGSRDAIAPSVRRLVAARTRRPLGQLEVSVTAVGPFARRVSKITGLQVLTGEAGLPGPGSTVSLRRRGVNYRAATFAAQGFGRERFAFTLLARRDGGDSSVAHGRLVAGAVLAGFFALALAFALVLSRALGQQIEGFLAAARRLGSGDFSQPVPVHGHDEFAALGHEFNRMSAQLEDRLAELDRERARLAKSMQRIGDTFASKLDRGALIEIALHTAIDALEGECGRASGLDGTGPSPRTLASVGAVEQCAPLLERAERDALGSGAAALVSEGDCHVLAQGLRSGTDDEAPLGVMAIARRSRPFEEADCGLFDYLTRQATVSVENVGLHEIVQRQAVTDELTGLFNHRRFHEDLELEAERARRFEQPVGLVMLDIDNFKRVNDTYGHQQGDQVLREVAGLMRSVSREIDSPARYGGEELALVLPQTDLDGAYQLAERLREAIADLRVPLLAGGGEMSVSASIGVAALPDNADEPRTLIAAADAALYEAKHAGKNKTVRAR